MTEEMPGIPPQGNNEQINPEEHLLAEVALSDAQPQVDGNGYLPDGTKPSYVEDVDLAHEAANASNEDRSEAALHREQGDTYHVDFGNNVNRDRHNDVARALDAHAEMQENNILNQVAESSDGATPEHVDDHERERLEKLVELRAEAARLDTALPKSSVENITQELRDIEPTNAYADSIGYSGRGNLDDHDKYDKAFRETLKNLTYAQKFGVFSSDRYSTGVEITKGWPDKYDPYRGSLAKTVELGAMSLFDETSSDEGEVKYAVSETAQHLDADGQLSRLAERLSYHRNTFYAHIESRPSIVLGQNKDGRVVAKAYFIVQVGDRSSKNLESVDLSAVDGVLQLASERLRPYSDEIDEGKRLANLVDLDAIKESGYEQAEERNKQFIEKFKASAPEFDDVPDTELYELLKMAATGDKDENTTRKQELMLYAMRNRSKLTFATNSDGNIVDYQSIRTLPKEEYWNGVFELWDVSGVNRVVKATYKGSPWHIASYKTQEATDANMSPEEITSLRKKILDVELHQSVA